MDEKRYYDEKEETKQITLVCPHCRQENAFPVRWIVRTKKAQVPPGGKRRRPREVREGAILHGSCGQHGGLPQHPLPETLRFNRPDGFSDLAEPRKNARPAGISTISSARARKFHRGRT
jgi:hypothetical protein